MGVTSEAQAALETLRVARGDALAPTHREALDVLARELDRLDGMAVSQEVVDQMREQRDAERARADRLAEDLRLIRLWFSMRAWEGSGDPSSHGWRGSYSPAEQELGYGTYRDPRYLPEALAEHTCREEAR